VEAEFQAADTCRRPVLPPSGGAGILRVCAAGRHWMRSPSAETGVPAAGPCRLGLGVVVVARRAAGGQAWTPCSLSWLRALAAAERILGLSSSTSWWRYLTDCLGSMRVMRAMMSAWPVSGLRGR